MFTLKGGGLTVSVLDPVEDERLLGTRYCTGGFIYQVDDERRGPLMAGPTYPDSYNLYDGQGIPDAFKPHLPLSGGELLGIGIGRIDSERNLVTERCRWRIERQPRALRLATEQAGDGWSLSLERVLGLEGRTLTSSTRLANTGVSHLPFQWYPHPFFPHFPGGECCRFPVPVTIPENPGYELAPNGFVRMKEHPWVKRSQLILVGYPAATPVSVLQRHPALSLVAARCDYATARFPIWGNERTFSFEPHYERVMTPGEEARWSVSYDF